MYVANGLREHGGGGQYLYLVVALYGGAIYGIGGYQQLLGLPAPDAVVYLQVDPAVSQKLMTGRYHGDESRKDVHEKDTEYLARSRRAAEYCAEHLGWATVHCTVDGAMRTIEDIQAEVQALAGNVLG